MKINRPVPTAGNTPDIGSELHQVILILSGPVCGRTVAKAIKILGTIKESIRDAERVAASSKEATPEPERPICETCHDDYDPELARNDFESPDPLRFCSDGCAIKAEAAAPIKDEVTPKCPTCGSDNKEVRYTGRLGAMDITCTHWWHRSDTPSPAREEMVEILANRYHLPGPTNFREALFSAYDAGSRSVVVANQVQDHLETDKIGGLHDFWCDFPKCLGICNCRLSNKETK